MYNILIVEDNPNYLKCLVNTISVEIPESRIYNFSFDAESTFKILDTQIVDILILDLQLPLLSGIDLIKYIEKNNLYKYKESIIVVSGDNILLEQCVHLDYVFSYHFKGNGFNTIIESIHRIINKKKNDSKLTIAKQKIIKELQALNYNFSYDGTQYLIETILEIYKIKYQFDGNLSKTIYPIIARKYNKKVNTIYCNIKQSTKYMILNCDKVQLQNYFGFSYYIKPKIQDVIFSILNKI